MYVLYGFHRSRGKYRVYVGVGIGVVVICNASNGKCIKCNSKWFGIVCSLREVSANDMTINLLTRTGDNNTKTIPQTIIIYSHFEWHLVYGYVITKQ